ncbi:MAG: ABC transporter permease subunit [Oscillospiraceae bacterium]|jgi:ABC-2 type transport system permease protein|nr:ABC transporter permease subunit [Oscillospiraceae bacterium]
MIAIYKRDLRAYFTSPLGYVFIAAFLILINGAFYITCVIAGTNQLSAVYRVMLYALIVVVPLLTMRTFSEDYKQRTDQLLLTSPVKPSGIVIGKFLAAYTVFVIALALTLVQLIIVASFGTPNFASAFGNYIAILAAAAVYIAIGVFISSLTENQLIAAIASLGIFVGLLLLDFSYSLIKIESVRTLIYWVSIYRRFNTFYMGVFSVSDFVYYVSAAAVFIFLTIRALERKRWS